MNAEGDLDLRALVSELWSGRYWIGAGVILFAGVFLGVAFIMTPVYRASAVLLPERANNEGARLLGSIGGLAAIAGLDLAANDTDVTEAIAVLRSREFTESFIARHNLLPILFESNWDAKTNSWKQPLDEQPTLFDGYKNLEQRTNLIEDQRRGLVTLQIDWKDGMQAATWVNQMVADVNEVMRARAIQRSDAYLQYLQAELEKTSTIETRNAIGRLIESRVNERMLASVTKEYAFRVVSKALVPDSDDPVRPNKLLMVVLGVATGGLIGTAIAILRKR